ncbi:MAG: M56 family metallopeptidase, partial [Planctomycetota bacterium]
MVAHGVFCFLQITAVSLLAVVLARVTLARAPDWSARLAGLGLAVSIAVMLAAFLPFHRPWNIAVAPPFTARDATAFSAALIDDVRPIRPSARGWGYAQATITGRKSLLQRIGFAIGQIGTAPDGSFPISLLLPGLFAVVIALLTARHLFGVRALLAIHRTSRPHRLLSHDARFTALAARSGCRGAIDIRTSSCVSSPCVAWLHPRVIYVPTSFATWSNEEQETALAHELGHLVRHDALHRLLATLFAGLLWFHPLAALLYRQLKLAQETAADRQAVAILGDSHRYVRGLARLALRIDGPALSPQYLISVSSHNMIRRIAMLSSMNGLSLRR